MEETTKIDTINNIIKTLHDEIFYLEEYTEYQKKNTTYKVDPVQFKKDVMHGLNLASTLINGLVEYKGLIICRMHDLDGRRIDSSNEALEKSKKEILKNLSTK